MFLSIITVTYQAEATLARTLRSVQAQARQDFEHVLIDGGSTDGTLALIRQYATERPATEQAINSSLADGRVRWLSEPDAGIYDAMNKGLRLARGTFVWFLNAGDELFDTDTVARLLAHATPDTDVLYGDALMVSPAGQPLGLRSEVTPHRLPDPLTWQGMALGMAVCHQSFVVRRAVAPNYQDRRHPYSADVDWEIACLRRARRATRVPGALSRYLTGGFSRQHLRHSLLDRFAVLQAHFGTAGAFWGHVRIFARGLRFALRRGGKYW